MLAAHSIRASCRAPMVVVEDPVSDYSLDAVVDLDENAAPLRPRVASKKGGRLAEVQAA